MQRRRWIVALMVLGAGLVVVVRTVPAQNWMLAPAYGEVELVAGFPDDPWTVDIVAGGSTDLSEIGYHGYVTEAPDYDLWYDAGGFPLTIKAETTQSGTLLLVNDPDGKWHFNVDSNGREPKIQFRRPAGGLYNIWVGSVHGELIPGRLMITER